MFYYFCKLCFNIVLLSLYIMEVFTEHDACVSKSGIDLTKKYTRAFLAGFIILIVDTINSTFITIYFHFKAIQEEQQYGVTTYLTRKLDEYSLISEKCLRLIMSVNSFWQYLVAHSATSEYCRTELNVLQREGEWLIILVVLQGIKGFLFMIWEFQSIYATKKDDWINVRWNSYDALSERSTIGDLSMKMA